VEEALDMHETAFSEEVLNHPAPDWAGDDFRSHLRRVA